MSDIPMVEYLQAKLKTLEAERDTRGSFAMGWDGDKIHSFGDSKYVRLYDYETLEARIIELEGLLKGIREENVDG